MDGDKILTAHFKLLLTPTPESTLTPTPVPCYKASEISEENVGETIPVCGKVTGFGTYECDRSFCPHAHYSFIKLDDQFMIASLYWEFTADWVGACLMVEDTLELWNTEPVFFFEADDGREDVECRYESVIVEYDVTYEDGEPGFYVFGPNEHCPAGDYFQPAETCEDSHFNLPELIWIPTRACSPSCYGYNR
jgi:hypothetical protein